MKKLLDFNSEKYEFVCLANTTMKNTLAIYAMQTCINVMVEKINELIDKLEKKDLDVNLEAFKATFLEELATLLGQKTEFEFSSSLFDLLGTERTNLKECFNLLEIKVQALTERVSEIESTLDNGEFSKPHGFPQLL